VICDAVRSAPESVTILCLGPLTNVARAFQRDPGLPALVDRLIMMGGSVDGVGNITPAAEFNMHYDPVSARAVFQSATTKTLVPLDVTRQVAFSLGLIEELPSELSRAGVFLRRVLPHYFRAAHQSLAQETISLHDAVALVAAVNPEMFEADYMAGDVESSGDLTRGATVFDQRPNREWRMNMEVVHTIDVEAVANTIVRNLQYAGQCTC
jgi:purine nucleosidase